jgi:crotonobetaine/carnitine-CoA ligase
LSAPGDFLAQAELERAAAAEPDREWIGFDGGRYHSFGEVLERVRSLAAGLGELGVGVGDRVAIALENRIEFVEAWFATQLAGAIAVPLNTALRGDALHHMLALSDPLVAITNAQTLPRIERALAGTNAVRTLVGIGDVAEGLGAGARPVVAYERIHAAASAAPVAADPHAESGIMFVSGGAGPAKGVVWTHRATWHFAAVAVAGMGYRREDVLYTCLPLFHTNGLCVSLLSSLLTRSRLNVATRFSVSGFWDEIVACGATVTTLLGAMSPLLLRREPVPAEREHALRTALVTPASPEYYEIFPRRFGFAPVESYGLADFGMLAWPRPGERQPPGSCGRAVESFDLRIVDEHGGELAPGEVGEAVARPLQAGIVPTGYWRMPAETLASRHDLWFHTGDAMRRDEDGWFYFIDRSEDAIRRRGENVSSYEVESEILALSGVEECAAYAVSSEFSEDEVAVAIVLEPARELSPEAIVGAIQSRIPYFAVPRYVRFVDSLPRTQTDRVQKKELRAAGVTPDTWDREAAGFELER